MHRIDKENFGTSSGKFTTGDVQKGIPATIISDSWLNDVQENICKIIEEHSINLKKGDSFQLLEAIQKMIPVKKYKCSLHAKGTERLKYFKKDAVTEIRFSKNTIAIWGNLYCVKRTEQGDSITSFGDFGLSKNNGKWEYDSRSDFAAEITLDVEESDDLFLVCTCKEVSIRGTRMAIPGTIYLSLNHFEE